MSVAGRAGLWFLYASGIVFVALELLSLAGIVWSRGTVLVAVFLLALGAAFLPRPPRVRLRWSPLDGVTALYAAAYTSFAVAGAPWHWDFWAIWGLKARTFFEHGGIDVRFLAAPWNAFAHPDYPQLVPLNLAFPAILTGGWDDRWLGALFAAYAVAAALVVRDLAARELAPHAAAAAALAALALTGSRYIGLAEVPLIAFSTAGLLFARLAVRGDGAARVPAGILIGLAACTKNEGFTLAGAAVVAMLCAEGRGSLRARAAAALPVAALAAVLAAPWLAVRFAADLESDLVAPGALARAGARLGDLGPIAATLADRVDKPWLWLVLTASLPLAFRRERFLFATVMIQLACFAAVYLTTPNDVIWQIETSWGRLSRQLLAPAAYAALAALAAHFAKGRMHAEARSDL